MGSGQASRAKRGRASLPSKRVWLAVALASLLLVLAGLDATNSPVATWALPTLSEADDSDALEPLAAVIGSRAHAFELPAVARPVLLTAPRLDRFAALADFHVRPPPDTGSALRASPATPRLRAHPAPGSAGAHLPFHSSGITRATPRHDAPLVPRNRSRP